jgi:lysophospholipase L1-like esterase
LWQLGTNSILRDHKASAYGAMIREGLRKIRAVDADVVLIDPQFVPKVIAKAEAENTVELLARTAKLQDVDLFRRFDVMKRWSVVDKLPFERFVSPDGLHMNDWGYACMAKGLGMAIAEAAQRPVLSATAVARPLP